MIVDRDKMLVTHVYDDKNYASLPFDQRRDVIERKADLVLSQQVKLG